MRKVKLTILNGVGSINVSVGDKVKLIHDQTNKGFKYDPKIFSVHDIDTNKKIGNVGARDGATVIKGTKNNEYLFDEMTKRDLANKDGYMAIEAAVVDQGRVNLRDGTNRIAFIVEVTLPEAPTKPDVLLYELNVRGSVREYKGKTTVLKDIQAGNPIPLWVKKEGDKLITYLGKDGEEIKAGLVSKATIGDLDKLTAYLEILAKRGQGQLVEPTSAAGNAYTVKFKIDQETFKDTLSGKVVRTLGEVKADVIKEGIAKEETLESIEKYLVDNNVPSKHIKQVFESMRVYEDNVQARIPNPSVKYNDSTGLVKKSIVYTNKGKHLRYVGEKGVGKNVLIETMAWIYQRPLYELSLTGQTDKMDILGSKTFESEVDKDGKEVTRMSFAKESLVEAMEVGGFMNLDEINAADPNILFLLHPIADGRGRLEVPGYGVVESDDNFGLLLSMNVDYIGTNPLNEATRDRFIPILFPEVPSIAKMLAIRVPDANPSDINLSDKVYGSIMKLAKDGQLSNDCVTNRGFIDALEASEDLGLFESLLDNVANRIEDEEYRTTVASIIDDIIG